MSNNLFPILGTNIPPMIGRDAIMSKMINALTKPSPDHLQMVGPRFSGKTVILHELATRFRKENSLYSSVILWDLGHQTPASNELFMQSLARELSNALKDTNHADYAEHLRNAPNNPYSEIAEVLDALKDEDARVLLIMDGFDKPLSNGNLTRNLWDQLRELALKSSLRLVTASRRTLRDLIRDPDAQTSDFWNIFAPNPVRVGCFNDADLASVLAKAQNWNLIDGAQAELLNASNGSPVLLLSILNSVYETTQSGNVTGEIVKSACDKVFLSLQDQIDALWSDCSPTSQDLFRRVQEEKTVQRAGLSTPDVDRLVEHGFIHLDANKLQRPNRLLIRYLEERPHEGSSILRLFGTSDAYQKNLKSVFERRVSQIDGLDSTLKRYLERAISDLPEHPNVYLSNVRGIGDQAFELIWKAELPDRRIPSDWIAKWIYNKESGIDKLKTGFPQGVHRLRLLNLMTGTQNSDPCAKYVTREICVLMNAVQSFGDLGQHLEGETIDPNAAYAMLNTCIEMAAALTRKLPQATN